MLLDSGLQDIVLPGQELPAILPVPDVLLGFEDLFFGNCVWRYKKE